MYHMGGWWAPQNGGSQLHDGIASAENIFYRSSGKPPINIPAQLVYEEPLSDQSRQSDYNLFFRKKVGSDFAITKSQPLSVPRCRPKAASQGGSLAEWQKKGRTRSLIADPSFVDPQTTITGFRDGSGAKTWLSTD